MPKKIDIRPEIKILKKEIIDVRRDIHMHPELSFEEYETSNKIIQFLKDLDIPVKPKIAKTGVVGTITGSYPGPTIALRADMDALPIQETSNLSYKSKNDGVMHACGHDGHIAMLLGVAKALNKIKSSIKGTVKLIFQPAEEGPAGALHMINDGAIEGVDQIYGIHLWNYQEIGTVGVKDGPIMAAADTFEITINGIGGHGATPHGTVDCVVVASSLINNLQTIVSRNTNPLESTVVTVGMINGGYNFNVIADRVVLKGTTRSYTEKNRILIKKRMHDIISGTEKIYGAKIVLDYDDGYPPTINDKNCSETVLRNANKIVGKGASTPYLSMGGEDFSYYLQKVPGCFFFVGSRPKGKKLLSVPHHCSHFDIDEKALLIGSSIFFQIIEDLLVNT